MGTNAGVEKYWVKQDLITYLQIPQNSNILNTNQIQACIVMMSKCDKIIDIYNKCVYISEINNYHYIDDNKSIESNSPNFREHRHDQSVLSLLIKLAGLANYDIDKYSTYHSAWDKVRVNNTPILGIRNRSGRNLVEQYNIEQ